MADGKRRKDEIQQNPFKRLKGFCVSPPEKTSAATPSAAPLRAADFDEGDLFAAEMERLGVARQSAAETSQVADAAQEGDAAPVSADGPPAGERELFLSALGSMESVFADDAPEDADVSAAPRRMRQIRRGELVPEAKLDLHGLSRVEAREKVRHFLDNSVYQRRKTVLIVTGRGIGSAGEPVLRAEIERYLRHEAAAWVAEWGRAPACYGGEGALVVFLKGRGKNR